MVKYKRKNAYVPLKSELLEQNKRTIIHMISRMNNEEYIEKIYYYVMSKYTREKERAGN